MSLLHSQILGKGTPLLVLHGFLGMSDNWRTMGKQWASHFQVHLLDLPNHGRSFHSQSFDYTAMTQDVVSYLDHHQLQAVIVLGHSMGGKLAMHLATTHPNRVEKLLVADIAPKAYPPHHTHILTGLMDLQTKEHACFYLKTCTVPPMALPCDPMCLSFTTRSRPSWKHCQPRHSIQAQPYF